MILDRTMVEYITNGKRFGFDFPKKRKVSAYRPSKSNLINILMRQYNYNYIESYHQVSSGRYDNVVVVDRCELKNIGVI